MYFFELVSPEGNRTTPESLVLKLSSVWCKALRQCHNITTKLHVQETTKEILKMNFQGNKTKMNDEAVQLVAEVASLAVVETVLRAGKQARTEGSTVIQTEHLEKVMPQLVRQTYFVILLH